MSMTQRDTATAAGGGAIAPRLAAAFAAPRARRAALIPYLTGGHLGLDTSHRLIEALIGAGADAVELGVPFSDPVADGPVVQASTHEALARGVTPDDVLALAAAHSEHVPFVLLAYLNTVIAGGPARFFKRAAEAGVEAVVIPDLPIDEMNVASDALPALADLALIHGVAVVPLAAPTSTDDRLDAVAATARGFIYCVAVTGVTGVRREASDELPRLTARLRPRTGIPLVAGFGISTPEHAAAAVGHANGVIIGSALIRAYGEAFARHGADGACAAAAELIGAASTRISEAGQGGGADPKRDGAVRGGAG